jgi:hypothetical protein
VTFTPFLFTLATALATSLEGYLLICIAGILWTGGVILVAATIDARYHLRRRKAIGSQSGVAAIVLVFICEVVLLGIYAFGTISIAYSFVDYRY